MMAAVASCFFVASLLRSPKLAQTAVLLFSLSGLALYVCLEGFSSTLKPLRPLLCLLPTVAGPLGIRAFFAASELGKPLELRTPLLSHARSIAMTRPISHLPSPCAAFQP